MRHAGKGVYLTKGACPNACAGLECLSKLGMSQISAHVGSLTRYLLKTLRSYSHPNGKAVVTMYPVAFFIFAFYLKCGVEGGIVSCARFFLVIVPRPNCTMNVYLP
jgi:hypothetical protein